MNITIKSVFMALALAAFAPLSLARTDVVKVTGAQAGRFAVPGDIAAGLIIREKDREQLLLNAKPCDAQGSIIAFHWPYEKSYIGEVNCGNVTVKIMQVEQK